MQLQFQAISLVTQVSADLVKRTMRDLVAALVQMSRRSAKELTVRFHRVGCLHLLKSRELVFEPNTQE